MAEALLRAAAARVLATSREPLRTEGECLYRVPSLTVPVDGTNQMDELLRHGSVRLFVARARAADAHFLPDGSIATAAAAICRRLDGIPLAIELAAARGAMLGIAEVASRLDGECHTNRRVAGRREGPVQCEARDGHTTGECAFDPPAALFHQRQLAP
jgi:predicted ATPase